jgi:hypothetical protein
MSKLILERFKCNEESDELGDDSPYFMVYVAQAGNGSTKSDVKFVRKASWDNNVSTGDLVPVNVTVSEGIRPDLVIVGMMEEDSDPDLGSPVRQIIAAQMKALDPLLAAVSTGISDNLAEIVRSEFANKLNAFASNDEILGVKRLKNPANPLVFTGDNSNYSVKFKIA